MNFMLPSAGRHRLLHLITSKFALVKTTFFKNSFKENYFFGSVIKKKTKALASWLPVIQLIIGFV